MKIQPDHAATITAAVQAHDTEAHRRVALLHQPERKHDMPRIQAKITPADITAAIHSSGALWRKVDPKHLARIPGLPTPVRKRQALLALAREALAALLIERFKLGNIQQLTCAIRAGHAGDATDFDAIDLAAAQSLGIL